MNTRKFQVEITRKSDGQLFAELTDISVDPPKSVKLHGSRIEVRGLLPDARRTVSRKDKESFFENLGFLLQFRFDEGVNQ